jgi:hypothetical protein
MFFFLISKNYANEGYAVQRAIRRKLRYLPFEEYLALYLNNFKFPLPKDDLYPNLIDIGLLVLEKIFQHFQSIFTLLLLSPLARGCSPFI